MTVKDALHQLKLEISENENRKDFSFSEKMEWAEKLKEEYGKIAKQNQLSRLNNQNTSSDKILPNDKIDSNKQVAEDVGFGNKETYRQAKYIYHNADDDTIQKLNEEKISIHKAWTETKEKLKQIENENKELKNRPPKVV